MKNGDVKWGDLDKDGDLDIIAAGTNQAGTDTVYIYRNDSNNVFTGIPHSIPHLLFPSFDYGDFNQDGKMDFLISGRNGLTNTLTQVYKNNGNFTNINATITGVGLLVAYLVYRFEWI